LHGRIAGGRRAGTRRADRKRLRRCSKANRRACRAGAGSRACWTTPPTARVDNEDSDFSRSSASGDGRRLLHDIARCRAQLQIVAVRASTRSSRATDAFCVTTLHDHKLVDPEEQRRVEAAILGAIGQGSE
jgi:UTP:GlnB (protein PII) uridylyltransferase